MVTIFQSEKQTVLNFYRRMEKASTDLVQTVLQSNVRDDYIWRGFHPFNKFIGGKAVATFSGYP